MKQNPRTGNWEHSKTKPKEEQGAPAKSVKKPTSPSPSKAKRSPKPGRG